MPDRHTEIWRDSVVAMDANIRDGIEVLNSAPIKILLLIDQLGTLVGIASDGDIRRGLVNGFDLSSPIESVVNKNPLVVSPDIDKKIVSHLMTSNKIQQIPVIDKQNKLVGLHSWQTQSSGSTSDDNIIMIMAGGKGIRLRPHTLTSPKPLLRISGKPILEHIIRGAKEEGFTKFIIAVHYLGDLIQEYFEDGNKLGVDIKYINEKSPLGTAGALSLLDPPPKNTLIVTNGDAITDLKYSNLLSYHQENKAAATVAVREHTWQNPFGEVVIDGIDIVEITEKPFHRKLISAGTYALEPKILKLLRTDQPCDMPTLLGRIKRKADRVVAFPVHESWTDITTPEDLQYFIEEEAVWDF